MTNLITELRAKLAGSTSQHPVDFDVLCKGHDRELVWDALRAMEADREIYHCLIIKGGIERRVWWSVRTVDATSGKKPLGIITSRKHSLTRKSRMSELSRAILSKVRHHPNICRAELIAYGLTQQKIKKESQVVNSIGYLRTHHLIVSAGARFSQTYAENKK